MFLMLMSAVASSSDIAENLIYVRFSIHDLDQE